MKSKSCMRGRKGKAEILYTAYIDGFVTECDRNLAHPLARLEPKQQLWC